MDVARQEARLAELEAQRTPWTIAQLNEFERLDHNRDQRRRRAERQLPKAREWVAELERRAGLG
ncbi:hypothetical protein GCM10011329_17920 [Stakelama pacifica]|nr:hypothetical protein GCM10011329_17920 [Stakelama pacifica]